jgi:hypothetical protein
MSEGSATLTRPRGGRSRVGTLLTYKERAVRPMREWFTRPAPEPMPARHAPAPHGRQPDGHCPDRGSGILDLPSQKRWRPTAPAWRWRIRRAEQAAVVVARTSARAARHSQGRRAREDRGRCARPRRGGALGRSRSS